MVATMKLFVILTIYLVGVSALLQNKPVVASRHRVTRLSTALPLPTQILDGALKSSLFSKATAPALRQLRSISFGWKAFVVMLAALITRAKAKLKREVKKAANQMETGWSRRGYNGSFRRTVEVWFFAIGFIFKYVSLPCPTLVF